LSLWSNKKNCNQLIKGDEATLFQMKFLLTLDKNYILFQGLQPAFHILNRKYKLNSLIERLRHFHFHCLGLFQLTIKLFAMKFELRMKFWILGTLIAQVGNIRIK